MAIGHRDAVNGSDTGSILDWMCMGPFFGDGLFKEPDHLHRPMQHFETIDVGPLTRNASRPGEAPRPDRRQPLHFHDLECSRIRSPTDCSYNFDE